MAWWIFQNVVVTAALALVVMLVCRTGRIGPVARHALWVLVLVKFVTPPIVVWPWAAPDPLGLAVIDTRTLTGYQPAAAFGVPDSPSEDSLSRETERLATQPAPRDVSGDRTPAELVAAAWPWLLTLWVAGSLLVLGLEGVRLARLARRIRAAPPVEPAIVARAAALSAQLGIRPVPVVGVTGHSSPVVWGLGRPRVLWPASLPTPISAACLDGLLMHELAHVKRRDHLVGWIELTAGIAWWWNPLFWYVRSALREQAELACDAWVVSALPDGRRAYAESLLTLSGAEMRGVSPVAVVGIRATSRRVLERRLVMIMQGRSPLRLPWVGLCALGLMASATLPAWATSAQQTPPTSVPIVVTPIEVPVIQEKPVKVKPEAVKSIQVKPIEVKPAPRVVIREPADSVQLKTEPATTRRAIRVQQPTVLDRKVVVTGQGAPAKQVVVTPRESRQLVVRIADAELPAEGQDLVKGFVTDVEARRAALIKSLEALQERYTKAGKLDEAVVIRDYIRAGLPSLATFSRIKGR